MILGGSSERFWNNEADWVGNSLNLDAILIHLTSNPSYDVLQIPEKGESMSSSSTTLLIELQVHDADTEQEFLMSAVAAAVKKYRELHPPSRQTATPELSHS